MKLAAPALTLIAFAVGAPAASSAQTAAAEAPPARRCFRPDDVNGFTAIDRTTVIVRVGVKDRYRLDLMGSCPDVDWSERIGIKSTGMQICSGLDADIISPSSIGPQRCPVKTITKLTPEEADALIAAKR